MFILHTLYNSVPYCALSIKNFKPHCFVLVSSLWVSVIKSAHQPSFEETEIVSPLTAYPGKLGWEKVWSTPIIPTSNGHILLMELLFYSWYIGSVACHYDFLLNCTVIAVITLSQVEKRQAIQKQNAQRSLLVIPALFKYLLLFAF